MATAVFHSVGLAATSMASADSVLALLAEDDARLKALALARLDALVGLHWSEIASALPDIEALHEQTSFPDRELAALVASKVYYHLEEFQDALKYALGAGTKFDVSSKTEYVETMIAKAIDQYIAIRVKANKAASLAAASTAAAADAYDDGGDAMDDEEKSGVSSSSSSSSSTAFVSASASAAAAAMDPRLEAIVDRMFDRCFVDGEYKQALGIALESRRLDRVRAAIEQSGDMFGLLSYALGIALTRIGQREFRHAVLHLLVNVYTQHASSDSLAIAQCLLFLKDAKRVADVLNALLRQGTVEAALMAYQVAFDLSENQNQPFLLKIVHDLPAVAVSSSSLSTDAPADVAAPTASDIEYNDRLGKLIGILSGETASNLHLQFLYTHSKTDLQIINAIKDKLEARNTVTNSCAVVAHAMMQCGTTIDTFLRDNLQWLGRATHWAKFTATASIGVIHKGHRKESMKLLGSYLPSVGSQGSPYSEGGALYALGLIHANHGGEHVDFLLDALKNARDEVIQHGACLGLGLSAMATGRDDLVQELLNTVYLDNAVAGEAAGVAIGLIMVGFGKAKCVEDMLQFANDTKHEKIIRGIAMGIALSMLDKEEEADTLIEQLLRSKDPLLRYGGVYTVALAYVGTANNSAIRRLLHLAVSDVADDVRRAAVTALGFVLCNEPARVPRVVSLLSESFNPYVRYGSAFAVGIACAGTGLSEALNLLMPMLKDRVDFVRQAAFIALSMVLIQSNSVQEPRVVEFRSTCLQAVESKQGDTMTKMGAIFATGIIDASGRNCTLGLRAPAGHKKMASIVGVAMFCQYWYWYPSSHFLSLAFTPTAVIGLNKDLQMPKNWAFVSNAKPSLFAYHPPMEVKKAVEVKKAPVAQLSVTAKALAKAASKKKEGEVAKQTSMEVDSAAATYPAANTDSMEVEKAAQNQKGLQNDGKGDDNVDSKEGGDAALVDATAVVEAVPEPAFERLSNPSRVTFSQQKVLAVDTEQRYVPLVGAPAAGAQSHPLAGFVMLRDTDPEASEELVKQVQPKTLAPDEEEEANAPEPFQFTR